jgi:AcrR family transcriptional regulator
LEKRRGTSRAPDAARTQRGSENRLLAAAAAIIAEDGYTAATLERVGDRAGFSRALASRKYGSKDGLIEAVIRRVSDHVHAQLDMAVADVSRPLDRLLTMIDRFTDLMSTDISVRAYFVLFSAMLANRLETRVVFQEVQDRYAERLQAMIAEGQAAGEISAALDPLTAAYVVGSLQAGLAIEAAMGTDMESGPIRTHLAVMLKGALGVARDQG